MLAFGSRFVADSCLGAKKTEHSIAAMAEPPEPQSQDDGIQEVVAPPLLMRGMVERIEPDPLRDHYVFGFGGGKVNFLDGKPVEDE